jgi:ankyrin repeat protein
LICAARKGHEDVVRILLDRRSVDADANNEANQTPICYTAENGHGGVVGLLLNLDNVDPNAKDRNDR